MYFSVIMKMHNKFHIPLKRGYPTLSAILSYWYFPDFFFMSFPLFSSVLICFKHRYNSVDIQCTMPNIYSFGIYCTFKWKSLLIIYSWIRKSVSKVLKLTVWWWCTRNIVHYCSYQRWSKRDWAHNWKQIVYILLSRITMKVWFLSEMPFEFVSRISIL